MELRKSQDFWDNWVVEEKIEMDAALNKFDLAGEPFWNPIGIYINEDQADAVIKEALEFANYSPVYEFFKSGAVVPDTGSEGELPAMYAYEKQQYDDEDN